MDAARIAQVLGGRKVGGCWMARCPAHQDREAMADGQAEPGAAEAAGGRGIALLEGPEEPLDLIGIHADARVGYGEEHAARAAGRGAHRDLHVAPG